MKPLCSSLVNPFIFSLQSQRVRNPKVFDFLLNVMINREIVRPLRKISLFIAIRFGVCECMQYKYRWQTAINKIFKELGRK